MPWRIDKREDKFCVIKETDGSTEKCHPTRRSRGSHEGSVCLGDVDTDRRRPRS